MTPTAWCWVVAAYSVGFIAGMGVKWKQPRRGGGRKRGL